MLKSLEAEKDKSLSYLKKLNDISLKSLQLSRNSQELLHRRVWIEEYQRLRDKYEQIQGTQHQIHGTQDSETIFKDIQQDSVEELEKEIKYLEFSFLENKFLTEQDFSLIEIYRILASQREYSQREELLDRFFTEFEQEISDFVKEILDCYFSEISELLKDISQEQILKRGFSKKELLKFKKIELEYASQSKEMLYQRLKKEFSEKKFRKKDFMELEFYIERIRIYNLKLWQKKRSFIDKFKQGLLQKLKDFVEFVEIQGQLMEKYNDSCKREITKKKNSQIITEFRQKLEKQKEIQEISLKNFHIERLEKERLENSKRQIHKNNQKQKIQQFNQKLLQQKNCIHVLEKSRLYELSLEHEISKRSQKFNLEKRRQISLLKEQEIQAKKEFEKEKRRNSQRILESLKIPVNVPSDPERIFKETASFSFSKLAQRETHLFPVHSFTLEKLMTDKRVVLSMALHAQGLQHSAYGREILASLGHEQTRDLKSNISF